MIDWERGFVWDLFEYIRALACTLLPAWALIIILSLLAKRQSIWLSRAAGLLPGFRGYVAARALADFSFALANFLDAGLPIGRAWLAAGLVSRSPRLLAAAAAIESRIALGEAPGAHLDQWRCFPSEFVSLYRAGENTGQLEAGLLQLAGAYEERARRALKFAVGVYSALLLVAVMMLVGWQIASFYTGYIKALDQLAAP